jgi:hypothetical protein
MKTEYARFDNIEKRCRKIPIVERLSALTRKKVELVMHGGCRRTVVLLWSMRHSVVLGVLLLLLWHMLLLDMVRRVPHVNRRDRVLKRKVVTHIRLDVHQL